MANGVFFKRDGADVRFYFPNPKAVLPVLTRSNAMQFITWGRRKKEKSALPLGGWAPLESVQSGYWDEWQPRPVKLPLTQFMEQDIFGNTQWFDITDGQFIQGLLARDGKEQRVYIVTILPQFGVSVYQRWPRILSGTVDPARPKGLVKPLHTHHQSIGLPFRGNIS